jgi:Nucleotidyl transferase AbiEii toxin, Type IV TA system
VLTLQELRSVADRFGVDDQQVRRDHLISLLLAVLSSEFADQVLFFGGTALSRTHLPVGRLSEDLDLIAVTDRRTVASGLDERLPRSVQRDYGTLVWSPALSDVQERHPAALSTFDGLTVRIQLLTRVGYPPWPTERRAIEQRYS